MAAFYDYPEGIAECAAEATAWVKVGTPEAISGPEEMAQVELLHEIIGNPFQSVSVDPRWLMPTVGDLAATVYEMRALPSGELDPDRLAVLSDALEEAGCDDADILEHLRSAGPHVRGCWALDLILGKQ